MSKLPISVIVLARNESRNIGFCLKPLKTHVAEILVLDTGSTDSTVSLAEKSGAAVLRKKFTGDFAALRNFAIRQAASPWILFLDADRHIDRSAIPELSRLISRPASLAYDVTVRHYGRGIDICFYETWSPFKNEYPAAEKFSGSHSFFETRNVLLFKNDMNIRFERPIHETVRHCSGLRGNRIKKSGLILHHFERPDDSENHIRKHIRYIKRLNTHLAKNPGDKEAVLHLMTDCLSLRLAMPQTARRRKPAIMGPDFIKLAGIFDIREKKYRQALQKFTQASAVQRSASLSVLSAHCHFMQGDFESARRFAEDSVKQKKDNPLAFNVLGAVESQNGKPDLALRWFLKSKNLYPHHPDTILNLIRLNEAAGNIKESKLYQRVYSRMKNQ